MGFSQTLFGNIAGVSKNTQINYENDGSLPSSEYLIRIAILGADIQYILTGIRSVNSDRAAIAAQIENNSGNKVDGQQNYYTTLYKEQKILTKKNIEELETRDRQIWLELYDLLNKDDRKRLLAIGSSLADANAVKKRTKPD